MMDTEKIIDYYESVDSVLAAAGRRFISELGPISKLKEKDYLSDLCESIVSQQLSVKAARTIWSRTHSVVDNWNDPLQIIESSLDDLRSCGLSAQKSQYVKNIAEAIVCEKLHIKDFDKMSNDDVIAELVQIKGIGLWTAEMFLIFTLARPDVFSGGDLGLRNAIKKLYVINDLSPKEATDLALKWSPYRSTACRILWKTLDNEPS